MTLPELVDRLRKRFTRENLERISVRLIELYRNKHYAEIQEIYRRAYTAELHGDFNDAPGKAFLTLIKTFHPDRLQKYLNTIDGASQGGNPAGLETLAGVIDAMLKRRSTPRPKPRAREPDVEEDVDRYYDSTDWAYDVDADFDEVLHPYQEEDADSDDDREYAVSRNFLEALVLEEPGLEHEVLTDSLLAGLEGDLNLSGYDIDDLSGIEACINLYGIHLEDNSIESVDPLANLSRLRSLYLSNNHITAIDGLTGLDSLEELDLSFNEIEDVTALFTLPALKLVNLVGCRVDEHQRKQLEDRGITVIAWSGFE